MLDRPFVAASRGHVCLSPPAETAANNIAAPPASGVAREGTARRVRAPAFSAQGHTDIAAAPTARQADPQRLRALNPALSTGVEKSAASKKSAGGEPFILKLRVSISIARQADPQRLQSLDPALPTADPPAGGEPLLASTAPDRSQNQIRSRSEPDPTYVWPHGWSLLSTCGLCRSLRRTTGRTRGVLVVSAGLCDALPAVLVATRLVPATRWSHLHV
jgi:hypothetical protein